VISGSDEGDKTRTSKVMLAHKRHDNIYTASMQVSGWELFSESDLFIKKRLKVGKESVELLDTACQGIIHHVLECHIP